MRREQQILKRMASTASMPASHYRLELFDKLEAAALGYLREQDRNFGCRVERSFHDNGSTHTFYRPRTGFLARFRDEECIAKITTDAQGEMRVRSYDKFHASPVLLEYYARDALRN
jgi:hypothetical protein